MCRVLALWGLWKRGQIRLRSRGREVVNDVVAELKGDFRVEGSRQRLGAELENIALPLGAPISFCLVSGTVTTPVATGKVRMEGQLKVARFGLDTNDGDVVHNVASGDKIEARKGVSGGAADCSKPLLVSATFQ
jgi:hypothetical protein